MKKCNTVEEYKQERAKQDEINRIAEENTNKWRLLVDAEIDRLFSTRENIITENSGLLPAGIIIKDKNDTRNKAKWILVYYDILSKRVLHSYTDSDKL